MLTPLLRSLGHVAWAGGPAGCSGDRCSSVEPFLHRKWWGRKGRCVAGLLTGSLVVPWVRGGDLAPVSSLPTSYSSGASDKTVLSQGLRGCRNRAARAHFDPDSGLR